MGEEVDHYREVLPAWYQAVFACSTPWSSLTTSHRYVVQPSDLRLLKALGGQLASVNYARPVAADQLAALLTHLDTTDELVRTSSDINDDVRRYMLGLISEARRVAKELQTFGDVELRTITFELGAAMLNVADTSVPEQNRQGWIDGAKGMLSRVAWKAGEKALESGSGAAIDAAMNAITG